MSAIRCSRQCLFASASCHKLALLFASALFGCLFAGSSPASGAIVYRFQENNVFLVDSGVHHIEFLVSSTTPADDSLFAFTADFELEDGAFAATPGEFALDGMIGFGNVTGASSFTRDTDVAIAYLSLEFQNEQEIFDSFTTIARLAINVNGLAPGTYNINVIDIAATPSSNLTYTNFEVPTSGSNGSFTIQATAIPEPGSFVVFAASLLGAGIYRRRCRAS